MRRLTAKAKSGMTVYCSAKPARMRPGAASTRLKSYGQGREQGEGAGQELGPPCRGLSCLQEVSPLHG